MSSHQQPESLYKTKLVVVIIVAIFLAFLILSAANKHFGLVEHKSELHNSGNIHKEKFLVALNEDNFDGTLNMGVVLVDFWAPWCQACKGQEPALKAVSEEIEGKAVIAKVNTDEYSEVAKKYDIKYLPTLVLFRNGVEMKRFIGVQSKETLISEIEKTL